MRNTVFVSLIVLSACGGSHKEEPPPASAAATTPAAPSAPSAAAPPDAAPIPSHTSTAPGAAGPTTPPGRRTVATVNGKPVPEEKVYALYRMNRSMLQQRGRTLTDSDEKILRTQMLQLAIADELFYQDAQKKGIKVSSAEVDQGMKELRNRLGSDEAYKKFLEDSGFSGIEVRKEIERNLVTDAYRKNLFAGKSVSDEQTRKFYDENAPKGMFNVAETAHVQYILVKVGEGEPGAAKADAKKKIEEAAKRAASGEDFAALAQQYSEDPTAERGGDIGFVPRGVMFPKFDEVTFALKPGGVSPAFETPRGFGVVKLLEMRAPTTRPYDEVKDALKQDMGRLVEQDALKAKANELASASKISVLDPSYAIPQAPAPQAQVAKP